LKWLKNRLRLNSSPFERSTTISKVQPLSVQRFSYRKTCFEASWWVWSADYGSCEIWILCENGASFRFTLRCEADSGVQLFRENTSDDRKTSEESRSFNWPQVIEMVECSWITSALCFLLPIKHWAFKIQHYHTSDPSSIASERIPPVFAL
jgi:hypothetical protein